MPFLMILLGREIMMARIALMQDIDGYFVKQIIFCHKHLHLGDGFGLLQPQRR